MSTSTSILITGANQGIGFEVAKQLLSRDERLQHHPESVRILAGARSQEKAAQACSQLQQFAAKGNTVEPVIIDVTDDASIEALAKQVTHLDILVNNAGISGGLEEDLSKPSSVRSGYAKVYDTNVFGLAALTYAMLPALRKSKNPRVVNVSSSLGSITKSMDPNWEHYDMPLLMYSSSKTALNAFTAFISKRAPDVKFIASNPGYTATSFNAYNGTHSVDVGAHAITHAILDPNAKTGSFVENEGEVLPW